MQTPPPSCFRAVEECLERGGAEACAVVCEEKVLELVEYERRGGFFPSLEGVSSAHPTQARDQLRS